MTITKRDKPLSVQLYEKRRRDEFNAAAMQNMQIAARRGRMRKGVPQFSDAEYERLIGKPRKKK